MQEGSFRCDVNVSIRPKGQKEYGTRVEIKNINSFRFVKQAIEYEVERQIEAYEDGVYDEEVWQETRLFDTEKCETKSMRGKEDSADYRYFQDPDLRPLIVTDEMIKEAQNIPELPAQKVERYTQEFGLKEYDAKVITAQKELANYFEELLSCGVSPKNGASWLINELLGRLNKEGVDIADTPISANSLGLLITKIEDGTISGKGAKDVLDYMIENKSYDIDAIIDELGLKQVSDDSAILAIIDEILANNEDKVEEFKSGKEKLFGFFVGQVMKASKGSANPQKVNELLKQRLS